MAWFLMEKLSESVQMEGRGFRPAVEGSLVLGALAPEAALLQGLKAALTKALVTAGLKPRPSTNYWGRKAQKNELC